MPAKLREKLGDTFLVTKGIGKCLFVFSEEEWAAFADKLKIAPVTDVAAQSFLRMLFANACECEPDKQGRILLPQNLRNHIEAEKELVVIGVGRRAEIWSRNGWDEYNDVTYRDYEQTLAKLAELGI